MANRCILDAEHPTIIHIYTQAYTIGHKVNPSLNASPSHSYKTWLLPNVKTLLVPRNRGDNHGDARSIGQVNTEADREMPQVESPQSYSGRTSGKSPHIRRHQPEEDRREIDARRLYSGRTSGRPLDIRRPATGRTSGAPYPESTDADHAIPDIRPVPGHPAPSPKIQRMSAQSERAKGPCIPLSHLPLRGLDYIYSPTSF